jgi:pilus assembly protein CpaF
MSAQELKKNPARESGPGSEPSASISELISVESPLADSVLEAGRPPTVFSDSRGTPPPGPEAVQVHRHFNGARFDESMLEHFREIVRSMSGVYDEKGVHDEKAIRLSLWTTLRELEAKAHLFPEAQFQAELSKIRQYPEEFIGQVLAEAVGLGPLEPLLKDPAIREIMINGPGEIFVERNGRLVMVDVKFHDEDQLYSIIQRILLPLGKRVDFQSPMVDTRLPDGSRVNVVIPPLSRNGPIVTIRKFASEPLTLKDLVARGAMSEKMMELLVAAVRAKLGIFVSGGTSTGKSSLLGALAAEIPVGERVIVIEETAELQLSKPNFVSLEARTSSAEGAGLVGIRELVHNALRMRPDRIIVGECRGGEAIDMLQAMNTGHEGSLTTLHANSPQDVLGRLEIMVMMSGLNISEAAIHRQIVGAVSLIAQLELQDDGSRRVSRLVEIEGLSSGKVVFNDIFIYEQKGCDASGVPIGRFTATGRRPTFLAKLARHGIELSPGLFDQEEASPDGGKVQAS